MATKDMFLYWGSGSAPCWKVIIVLAEKGLWDTCPQKLCEFSKKEHKGDDVLKLNPRGQMPTFRDGKVIVNESSAICMYLEEKYSKDDNRLLPTDPAERALVYQRMFESANIQSNIMMGTIYYMMTTKKEEWNQDKIKEAFEKANVELERWEKYLTGQKYLAGDKFTMADVFFYPFLATLVRQGASLEKKYPALNKYYDTCGKIPSIIASKPPHWKDSPSPNLLVGLCD